MQTIEKPKSSLDIQSEGTILMPQLLSIKDVMKITSLSRATIYDLLECYSGRYDPSFPKQVKLSQNRVVWVASELFEWIRSKMDEREAVT